MQTSPFKFLDAYDKEDKEAFFGRDNEIELLYQMAFQTNMTLVYGQSGTGKTSLIQCGLANRFESSDWYHLYVRRNEDINESLRELLEEQVEAIPQHRTSLEERLLKKRGRTVKETAISNKTKGRQSTNDLITRLYGYYLKPVYLLFDQFEELYILGDTREQHEFYQTIGNILNELPFVKVLLIMREEYIAQLYDFEKIFPKLFEKRLRVEPMDQNNARNVILQSADKFKIRLEKEEVAQSIVDAVTEGKGRVNLTYLQVFLDKLYRVADTHPGGARVFDMDSVNQLGKIDDVLTNFLEEQLAVFQHTVGSKNTALTFLQVFVSSKGTKVPIRRCDLPELLPDFTAQQLNTCLEFFEEKRILRPLENVRYELTHDSIATKIASLEIEKIPMPAEVPPATIIASPFPGYKPYGTDRAQAFFGREKEVRQLFDKVVNDRHSRLTLMYGPMGVGKTSLVCAGLIPRLEQVCEVKYFRLRKQWIDSEEVQQMLCNTPQGEQPEGLLYKMFFPKGQAENDRVVLIFDQFENLFIWESDKEKLNNFYRHITHLLGHVKNCRMLFVLREAFFAFLSDFETILPTLLDNRMRVNAVNAQQAQTIISKLLNLVKVEVENEVILHRIAEKVSEGETVNLTWLQIYLQRLAEEVNS